MLLASPREQGLPDTWRGRKRKKPPRKARPCPLNRSPLCSLKSYPCPHNPTPWYPQTSGLGGGGAWSTSSSAWPSGLNEDRRLQVSADNARRKSPPPTRKSILCSQPGRQVGSSWGVAFCVHCALLPSCYRNCEVTVWVQRWRHSCYSPRPKSYLLLTFNCPPNHFWEDDISGITRSNATSSKICPLCMQLILDIRQV